MTAPVLKSVLLVAYHFPPVGGLGAAGSQRALKFVRYLPSEGWRPVVLTAREDRYESYLTLDAALGSQIPEDLLVVRTNVLRGLSLLLKWRHSVMQSLRRLSRSKGSEGTRDEPEMAKGEHQRGRGRVRRIKDAITDLFEIPDEVSGWIVPAIMAGVPAIRKYRVSVIVATGRPWTSLVIGMVLKMLTQKPLVVDFRDPWMTNPFRLDYSGFRNRVEAWLERRVLKSADLVIANTEDLRDEFRSRASNVLARKCTWIPNGFDQQEFRDVVPAPRTADEGRAFMLTHSGFLYGKRDPESLLDALVLLRRRGEIENGRFICKLIGPRDLPYDLPSELVTRDLTAVVTLTDEVTYEESIAQIAACDVALLLQPGTVTQIPSKIFEYAGLGKRMLAIAPEGSGVARLVEANDLGIVADPVDVEGIARAIKEFYQEWRSHQRIKPIAAEVRERFDVRHSVKQLAESLNSLYAQHK